jgi:putative membrane protein
MDDLDDPRVLLAVERTLLAWSRTATGLMAFGFLIDRAGLMIEGAGAGRDLGFWIGLAFVLLGALLSGISVMHYRRSLVWLRPKQIPPGYWLNLAVFTSAATTLLGFVLAGYLLFT